MSMDELDADGELTATIMRTIGALVIVLDVEGRIVMANDAVSRLLGYADDELTGQPIWAHLLSEEEVAPIKAVFERLVAGQPGSTHINDLVAKDGTQHTFTWSNAVIRDTGGVVTYVVGTGVDVTERDISQRRLRRREAYLRSIFDTAVDAIVTIDAEGRIESFSPSAERLFGYDEEAVISQNVSMLMPEPDRSAHDGYIARYLETGEARIIGIGREISAQRNDGTIFPAHLAISQFDVDGRTYFTGIVRDMTEQQARDAAYRQAQKMEAIGQLTGGIAHDFNNLLTVMMGNLEMLETRLGEDERQRELLKEALEAAALGAQLTHRLLAFARRQALEPTIVDLNELVLGTSEMLRRTLGEDIQINVVLASDIYSTSVDPGQVENALLNLVINARDAMPDGGSVTIETTNADLDDDYASLYPDVVPGPYVLLTVTDTGHGIPADLTDRVFDPFFTTKETGAGTGMGLSMVFGFVKQSGGHVRLYSEHGYGTTVNLYLPKVSSEDMDEADETVVDTATLQARGETVLVVEDDVRVRRITVMRLAGLGYRVLEADSGQAAMDLLEKDAAVDLLFTDIIMPGGMTGRALGERVQAYWPTMRILYTSGYAEPALVETDLMQTGMRLLRKPYSLQQLAVTLREVLDAGE